MRLLLDMNLSPRWVVYLANYGINALHWSDLGPANAPDDDLMAYAVRSGLVLLTGDLDFGILLLSSGATLPSVIQMRGSDFRIDALGPAVVATVRQHEQQLAARALITISENRTRLVILPFPPRNA